MKLTLANNLREKLPFVFFLYKNPFFICLIFFIVNRALSFYNTFEAGYGDYARDYLVGYHIAHFGENPVSGPYNMFFLNSINSPNYYWLMAMIVKINDSIFFPGIVNIILLILSALILYKTVRSLSNSIAANITASFYLLSDLTAYFTFYTSQHTVMTFFFIVALYFLEKYYRNTNFRDISFSLFFFYVSISLHLSALTIAPLFLVIVLLLLLKNKTSISRYTFLLITSLVFFLFSFSNLWTSSGDILSIFSTIFIHHENVRLAGQVLFDYLFFFQDGMVNVRIIFFLIYIGILFICLKKYKISWIEILLVFGILLPVLIYALVGKVRIVNSYYSISFIFFFMLSGLAFSRLYLNKKNHVFQFLGILFCIISIIFFSRNFAVLKVSKQPKNYHNSAIIAEAIYNDIKNIRSLHNYPDNTFFQLKLYMESIDHFPSWKKSVNFDAFFWIYLERRLDTQLVKLIPEEKYDRLNYNYTAITEPKYMYVLCQFYPNTQTIPSDCLQKFSTEFINYVVVKKLIHNGDFTVFVAKKNDN